MQLFIIALFLREQMILKSELSTAFDALTIVFLECMYIVHLYIALEKKRQMLGYVL